MRVLAWLTAILVSSQAAIPREVPIVVPAAMQGRELEIAVVCRETQGGWSGVEAWSRLDTRAPRAVVRNGCRVLLRVAGSGVYAASGVVYDKSASESITFLPGAWRTARAGRAASQPYWVSDASPAAECMRTSTASLCLFVSADDPGVLVTIDEAGLRFALSPFGKGGDAAWRAAPWGRFVRVRAPGGRDWSARVSVLVPALKHGRDLLRHSRVSEAAVVHRLGDGAIWLEGGEPEPGARLELTGRGAATTQVELSRVRGSPLTSFDVALAPEEIVEGEVRSDGRLLGGAAVNLMRLLAPPARRGAADEDERPMERVAESVTDATGRFRFDGLPRGDYELSISHPRRGRARLAVRAPSVQRVTLKPHSLVRGRVVRAGVPVAGAVVTVLPSYDAVLAARDPSVLIGESARTALDGRFELVTPDQGHLTLTALGEEGASRVALGDAQALPSIVELGDLRLDDQLDIVILLDLPAACVVSAAGPLGQPGIMLRRTEWVSPGRWILRSALEGRWLMEASCDGVDIELDPPMLEISRGRRELVRLTPRRPP